jgi:hypothetical protein
MKASIGDRYKMDSRAVLHFLVVSFDRNIGSLPPLWTTPWQLHLKSFPINLLSCNSKLRSLTADTAVKQGTPKKNKNKLHGLSPRANYTYRATAASRRSDCQLLRIKGATWSAWRIPTAVFSRFSRQKPLLLYQVAPQSYSRGWVNPVPDPLLFSFFLVVPRIEPGPPDL